MKTEILPRSSYEVYFIPHNGSRPSNLEVTAFLRAHHPCFSRSCRIDRRRCVIAGESYEMVTVLYRSARLTRARCTTASAIFARSGLSGNECIIVCPGEIFYAGKEPRSEERLDPASVPEGTRKLYRFETNEEILAFAEREGISAPLFRASRFRSRLAVPLAVCLALPALAFALIQPPSRDALPATAITETPQPISASAPVAPAPRSFWDCLFAEMRAIDGVGGKIVEYRHAKDSAPPTVMRLRCDRPVALLDAFEECETLRDSSVAEIEFTGNVSDFTLSLIPKEAKFASKKTIEPSGIQRKAFAEIASFRALCASEGFSLTAIQSRQRPEYAILLNGDKLPSFLIQLPRFCDDMNLDVYSLSIQGKPVNDSFFVTLRFMESPEPVSTRIIQDLSSESDYIRLFLSVFDIKVKKKLDTKLVSSAINTSQQNRGTLVGMIRELNAETLIFLKNPDGKMRAEHGESE